MSDGAIAQATGCAWCGRDFTPRTGGGLPQRFCSTRHRRLFHSTARKFAERAISLGFLTADDLPAFLARTWKPGESGNPAGHSGEYGEVLKLARALSMRAIERLGELIESEDERVAVVAANAVLDRALGKPRPAQDEKAGSLEERIAQMTPEERRARMMELLERARLTIEGEAEEAGE